MYGDLWQIFSLMLTRVNFQVGKISIVSTNQIYSTMVPEDGHDSDGEGDQHDPTEVCYRFEKECDSVWYVYIHVYGQSQDARTLVIKEVADDGKDQLFLDDMHRMYDVTITFCLKTLKDRDDSFGEFQLLIVISTHLNLISSNKFPPRTQEVLIEFHDKMARSLKEW